MIFPEGHGLHNLMLMSASACLLNLSFCLSCFQVYYLRGIGKLLQLLDNDNEEVQRVAAGSLRNVVFQSSENKMEVKESDGVATILSALKSSRDVETRRQLAGQSFTLPCK